MMYGICLLHGVHRLAGMSWAEGLLLPCVCGFFFISGWFGVKFLPSKILKLYSVQLYCAVVVGVVQQRVPLEFMADF